MNVRAPTPVAPGTPPAFDRPGLRAAAAVVCAALGAFTLPLGIGPNRRGFGLGVGWSLMLQYGLVDAVLFAVLAVGVIPTARRVWARRAAPLVSAGALLVAALAVSFAFHPIDRGLLIVVRLAACLVVSDAISAFAPNTVARTVARVLVAMACFEWTLATFQLVSGRSLGLWFLGERPNPLVVLGTASSASGTFFHPYLLSGFLTMAAGVALATAFAGHLRWRWAIALAAMAGSTAALSYSRTALAGCALLAVSALAGARSAAMRRPALAIVAALGLSAFVSSNLAPQGWTAKAEITAKADVGITNGRVGLLKENLRVWKRSPLVGVGVGRYTTFAVDEDMVSGSVPKPPHMIPAAALTEAGLLAVPALGFHVVAVTGLLRRRRLAPLAAYSGVLAPLLLDQYMWNTPEGMVMVALAFGVASALARPTSSELDAELDPEPATP